MSVVYKSSSTANSGSSAASSIVLNIPVGTAIHDSVYVFFVFTGGTGITITPVTSFSLRGSFNDTTTYGTRAYRRTYDPSDGSSYTFNLSSAQFVSAVLVTVSGQRLFGSGSFFPEIAIITASSTGSTTATTSDIIRTDNGFGIKITASYNTTGVLTTTSPGAGLTTRADTSTTGTSFMQLSVADGITTTTDALISKTFPASTLSGAATKNVQFSFYIKPDITQVTVPAVDYTQNIGLVGTTGSSLSIFNNVSVGTYILAVVIRDAAGTVTGVTSANVTWKFLGASQNPGNTIRTEVWVARGAAQAVTSTPAFTFSGAVEMEAVVCCFAAGGSITNVTTASANTGVSTSTIVTKTNNALVIAVIGYAANSGATPAGSNVIMMSTSLPFATAAANIIRQLVTTAGTSATSNVSAPTTTPWAMVQFEVPSYGSGPNFLSSM